MNQQLDKASGAPVTVTLEPGDPVSSYTIRLSDGTPAGRADFVDAPDTDPGRIFFHTEVFPEFNGRGLAGRLVRAALADSIRNDVTVVPVCPLFADHLRRQGVEFLAEGGRFRQPTRADFARVKQAMKIGA